MKPYPVKFFLAALAVDVGLSFVPNHLICQRSLERQTSFNDLVSLCSTNFSESILGDDAINFAYEQWRAKFGRGDFDPIRFENFVNNYKLLMTANIKAKDTALAEGRVPPEWLELNEYGDFSREEYRAMKNGAVPPQQASLSISAEAAEQAISSMPNNSASFTASGDQYGRTISPGETQEIESAENLNQNPVRGTQVIQKASEQPFRGTQVIGKSPSSYTGSGTQVIQKAIDCPSSELEQPSFQGTQVIRRVADQPPFRGTQVIRKAADQPPFRGTQVIRKAADETQLSATQNPSARGTQVIQKATDQNPFARGTRVIQRMTDQSPSAPVVEQNIRGTEVIQNAADQNPFTRGTQVVKEAADDDQNPFARGTQVIQKASYKNTFAGGTQVIQSAADEPVERTTSAAPGSDYLSSLNGGGTSTGPNTSPGLDYLSSLNKGNTGKNEPERGTYVIQPSTQGSPPEVNGGSIPVGGSGRGTLVISNSETQTDAEMRVRGTQSLGRPSFNTSQDPPISEETVETGAAQPVRGTFNIPGSSGPIEGGRRQTILIEKSELENKIVPSVFSFFGGAKKQNGEDDEGIANSSEMQINGGATAPQDDWITAQLEKQRQTKVDMERRRVEAQEERARLRQSIEEKRLEAVQARKERAMAQAGYPVDNRATYALHLPENAEIPEIREWKRNADGSITGFVFNSRNFKDGTRVTTSPVPIATRTGTLVNSDSGTQYRLA